MGDNKIGDIDGSGIPGQINDVVRLASLHLEDNWDSSGLPDWVGDIDQNGEPAEANDVLQLAQHNLNPIENPLPGSNNNLVEYEQQYASLNPEDKKSIQITGTVTYIDLEGGFYGIVTKKNEEYLPLNIQTDLNKYNKRIITIYGYFQPNVMTIFIWGTLVYVEDWSVAEPEPKKIFNLNYSGSDNEEIDNNVFNAINYTNIVLNDIIQTSNRDEIYDITVKTHNFGSNSEILGDALTNNNLIRLNSVYASDGTITINDVEKHGYSSILIHEVLHILGLINTTNEASQYDIVNYHEGVSGPYNSNLPDNIYYGEKGVAGYKKVLSENGFSVDNLADYIPIEDDFSEGTKHFHFEEGTNTLDPNDSNYYDNREINDINYPAVVNEIMTGFLDNHNYITPMTLGCLQDIGFTVNYESNYVVTKGEYLDIQSVI